MVFRNGTYDLLFKGWEVAFGGDTLFYLYRIGKKLRFRAYSGLVEHCILASSIVLMLPLGLSKVLQSCGSTEKSIVLFADTVKNYRLEKVRCIYVSRERCMGYAKEGCSSMETKGMIKVFCKGGASYREEGCKNRSGEVCIKLRT